MGPYPPPHRSVSADSGASSDAPESTKRAFLVQNKPRWSLLKRSLMRIRGDRLLPLLLWRREKGAGGMRAGENHDKIPNVIVKDHQEQTTVTKPAYAS